MIKIDAVIMAAGQSKRMGNNKLLLNLGNISVIEHLLKNIPYNIFNKTILIYSNDSLLEKVKKYPIDCIKNNYLNLGKSHTISLAQQECINSDGTIYFVADQPLLTKKTIMKLIDVFKNNNDKIIIPKVKNKMFNPVIFPSSTYSDLLNLKDDEGGKAILNKYSNNILEVDFLNEIEFMDIDTKEDLDKIKKYFTEQ